MTQRQWSAVDRYFDETLVHSDAALDAATEASTAAGLPAISVAPNAGRLLMILALTVRATRILEIGTLGGYSTIWMAKALPEGGRLVSLEIEARNAEIARANVANAGLADRVEIRLGAALDSLPQLAEEKAGPFDLVFIDADKRNNTAYVDWALKLTRPGSLIIIDNVVRGGSVADASSRDASVLGARRVIEMIASEPRLVATAMQTVGVKGYDGFAIALVTG